MSNPSLQAWFTPDEGGASDAGKWAQVGYHNWNPKTASPHGWSMAEFWHLMRESFLFEDGDSLVVFGGVNGTWLSQFSEIKLVVRNKKLMSDVLKAGFKETAATRFSSSITPVLARVAYKTGF